LIGCAADRQTVTHDALARRIKRGGPNLLATREQGRVWEFDWYAILPPTIEELAEK
jgi:hypothetical protein